MKNVFSLGVFTLVFIRKDIGGCFEVVEASVFSLEHCYT